MGYKWAKFAHCPCTFSRGTADTSWLAMALPHSVKEEERNNVLSAQVGNLILTHQMRESHQGMACALGLVHSVSEDP